MLENIIPFLKRLVIENKNNNLKLLLDSKFTKLRSNDTIVHYCSISKRLRNKYFLKIFGSFLFVRRGTKFT